MSCCAGVVAFLYGVWCQRIGERWRANSFMWLIGGAFDHCKNAFALLVRMESRAVLSLRLEGRVP